MPGRAAGSASARSARIVAVAIAAATRGLAVASRRARRQRAGRRLRLAPLPPALVGLPDVRPRLHRLHDFHRHAAARAARVGSRGRRRSTRLLGVAVAVSPWLWARLLQRFPRRRDARPDERAAAPSATLLPVWRTRPGGGVRLGRCCSAPSCFRWWPRPPRLVRHNLAAADWPAGITGFTIVFAAGQIVGPSGVGFIADRAGGLRAGLALLGGAAGARRGRRLVAEAAGPLSAAAPFQRERISPIARLRKAASSAHRGWSPPGGPARTGSRRSARSASPPPRRGRPSAGLNRSSGGQSTSASARTERSAARGVAAEAGRRADVVRLVGPRLVEEVVRIDGDRPLLREHAVEPAMRVVAIAQATRAPAASASPARVIRRCRRAGRARARR